MRDPDLLMQLSRLRRRFAELQNQFQHQRLDEGLLTEIDTMMENGIASDERTAELRDLLDALRDDVIITRAGKYDGAARDCERVKAVIDRLISGLG